MIWKLSLNLGLGSYDEGKPQNGCLTPKTGVWFSDALGFAFVRGSEIETEMFHEMMFIWSESFQDYSIGFVEYKIV